MVNRCHSCMVRTLAGQVPRRPPGLPLEVDLHEPLLSARAAAGPQHRLPHVARLRLVQAHACVRVLYCSRLSVISPLLVAPHAVTANKLDRTARVRRVQTVVVRHNLLALRVRKYLVSAHSVAVPHAERLSRLAAERIQTVGSLTISNLSKIVII